MTSFLRVLNSMPRHSDGTPGHDFPSSEQDGFFADRDTVASTNHPCSLPSFPEAFGGPNNCDWQPFPSSLYPVHADFSSSSPADNVPLAFDHSSNSGSHNNSSSLCQTRVSALGDRSFSSLSQAPLYSQRQRQDQHQREHEHQHEHEHQYQYQHQHQYLHQHQQPQHSLDHHPVTFNPHPFLSIGLDLDSLNCDLELHHNTSHHQCTNQQPPSTSQASLPRLALLPTTTAPSIARLDHEYAPNSTEAPPPFSTSEQPHNLRPPLLQPPPQPNLGGDRFVDALQAQIPGDDGVHFIALYDNTNNLGPFPFWHPPMTSTPSFNPNPFEPETAMPSLANPPSARRRSSRRLSNGVVDLTKEEGRDSLTSSSPVPMAPPPTSRKRRRSTTTGGGTSASNARRTSASQPSKAIKTEAKEPDSRADDACVFGSSPPPAPHSDEDVLDLTEANEISAAQKKIEADRRVKLSKFQCVICMDDVTNLTVTHCGHLFCSSCLHSSLHIDSTKKSCPVCRTKVDPRSKTGKNTKSFYHLELKVMTATRKGKQPAAATR